ncbi:hypothetical protein RR42_m1446 [Cupriavidus basilensis]|uniref:Uncharacterized protein n=2 Tax=Cupriavidus basilensis TaxID=68895 RepID=A0A0C4Y1C4_9BURK|nr:hypothetical protein RR42_m1446 [Cupriavidus basilensis]
MALFRAYADPYKEVEQPFQQLMSWALPKKLSSDSIIKRAAGAEGVTGYLKALLPSQAPQLIGFQYKRRTYAPMVIENIGEPLNSPVASNGYYTELLVPMTIATLTALDRDDIQRIAAPGTDVGPAA